MLLAQCFTTMTILGGSRKYWLVSTSWYYKQVAIDAKHQGQAPQCHQGLREVNKLTWITIQQINRNSAAALTN